MLPWPLFFKMENPSTGASPLAFSRFIRRGCHDSLGGGRVSLWPRGVCPVGMEAGRVCYMFSVMVMHARGLDCVRSPGTSAKGVAMVSVLLEIHSPAGETIYMTSQDAIPPKSGICDLGGGRVKDGVRWRGTGSR